MVQPRVSLAFLVAIWPSACRSLEPAAAPTAALAPAVADPAPASGHYVGFAKPEQVEARLPAVVDLVRLGDGQGVVNYRAVVRLASGSDYGSAYFGKVQFHRGSRSFTWADGPEGVTLSDVQLAGSGATGELQGTLSSAADQSKLSFAVAPAGLPGSEAVAASVPLQHELTGSYTGLCPALKSTGLQLETSRWSEAPATGLFRHIQLSGRLVQEGGMCSGDKPCFKQAVRGGSYRPLSGRVELELGQTVLSCLQKGEQLVCGDCTFVASAKQPHAAFTDVLSAHHARSEHLPALPPLAEGQTRPLPTSAAYYGYLHHEATDRYQLIALNMTVERALQAAASGPVASSLQASGVASLYFGEGDSSELIAYRFNQVAWNGQDRFVLDGKGEVFIVIERFDDQRLMGTWYSKTFGRIGTMELQPGLVPILAAHLQGVDRVSHLYRGGSWEFELAATANVSDEASEFYPLSVTGWAKELDDQARRRSVKKASLDPYTGRLALKLDDGRTAIGQTTPAGLQMYWPPKPHLGAALTESTLLYRPVTP